MMPLTALQQFAVRVCYAYLALNHVGADTQPDISVIVPDGGTRGTV